MHMKAILKPPTGEYIQGGSIEPKEPIDPDHHSPVRK